MHGFDVITFDCYGTLIDWESGIRTAFKHAFEDYKLGEPNMSKLVGLYQEEEKRIESQRPFMSYRKVLSEAASAAASKIGLSLSEERSAFLARELPGWKPFQDTNPALERLAKNHSLGILSNVDNDLLAGTMKHFTIPFDLVVTAEKVRSYKPGFKHFEEAQKHIGSGGWLHVAASLYYDIDPASRLGLKTVWVNRKNSREGRKYLGKIVREVENLAQLANWLSP